MRPACTALKVDLYRLPADRHLHCSIIWPGHHRQARQNSTPHCHRGLDARGVQVGRAVGAGIPPRKTPGRRPWRSRRRRHWSPGSRRSPDSPSRSPTQGTRRGVIRGQAALTGRRRWAPSGQLGRIGGCWPDEGFEGLPVTVESVQALWLAGDPTAAHVLFAISRHASPAAPALASCPVRVFGSRKVFERGRQPSSSGSRTGDGVDLRACGIEELWSPCRVQGSRRASTWRCSLGQLDHLAQIYHR